jgi:hypothetical protein
MGGRMSHVFCIAFIGLAVLGGAQGAWAQQIPRDFINVEHEKKAKYLIYFGLYVDWPPDAVPHRGDRFVIGVLGPDPLGEHLRAFEGRSLGDKRIVVYRFASIDEYRPCHILFISRRAAPQRPAETPLNRLQDALERVGQSPVLVVTESSSFARRGSMINFVADMQAGLIKMEINLAAARRAGLEIRAPLLNLKPIVTVLQ